MVQLPAELTDVRDAHREHARASDLDVAGAEEGEPLVGEVVARDPLQQLARPRPGDREHAVACGDVLDPHRPVLRGVTLDPGEVVRLGRCRRHDVVAAGLDERDGDVGLDAAPGRAHLRQRHPPHLGRQPVGAEPVEQRLGALAADDELREARLVEHADAAAHRAALLADGVEPVAAAERVLVAGGPGPREPERALPAGANAHHRALGHEAVVERVGLERAARRPLLLGEVDLVLVLEHLATRVARRTRSSARSRRSGGRRAPTCCRSAGPSTIHSAAYFPAPPPNTMPKIEKPASTCSPGRPAPAPSGNGRRACTRRAR